MMKNLKTKSIISSFIAISFLSMALAQSAPTQMARASSSGGGPIVLDGMDPVCHANYGEGTDQYIAKVVKSVYDQSSYPSNNNKIAILGVSGMLNAGGCGGNWTSMLSTQFLTQFSTQPAAQFVTSTTELDAFFAGISTDAPRMIWIPDDWSRSSAITAKFTANAEVIADFVNSGGGLFSSFHNYGWLTSLLPLAVFNNGGCNGGPVATADGTADFGLTNTDVAACWHGHFTGGLGTLKTLAEWRFPDATTSPFVAVSIGGGEVSLPSSFTLALSPANPAAGEDLTITATAQTIAGVPQEGVVVTVTVSAGPDAGQTFSATTNSLGVATIVVRTSATGAAVYTATAVVNGVSKTVSASIEWTPAPTTVPAPTTTTVEEPTTTTSQPIPSTVVTPTIPSTTTVVPVVDTTTSTIAAEQTTTTDAPILANSVPVHDHSSHSHEALPQTGSESNGLMQWALILIFSGLLLFAAKKIRRKIS